MAAGLFAHVQDREPALLTALLTLIGGFVAQAGPGHIASLKALGTSVTVSGIQGLVTRGQVFSPAGAASAQPSAVLSSATPWLAHGAEPALMSALVGLAIGFLVQVVGGEPDLLQALGIAAGLAGTQGVLTRQQVYSPRTVALKLLAPGAHLGGMLAATGATGPTGSGPAATAGDAIGSGHPASPVRVADASGPTRGSATAVVAGAAVVAKLDPGFTKLLARYRPEVRYDSLENYFADSAGVITDRPGNVLKRQDGAVIATAGPQGSLKLGFLASHTYADGQPVDPSDRLDEVGNDYVAQARELRSLPGYADQVHGRVVVDSSGTRWLQYWFFMYYDDPGFLGLGTHEGDIEMIQLRLDPNGRPDAASYSQHRSGVQASWSELDLASSPDGPVPVTYSARGSHANLLRAGDQVSLRSFLPDHNDGEGHRVRPSLIELSDTGTPWCLWPGTWGGTHASGSLGDLGIAANSPAALTRHHGWHDPVGFHNSCDRPDDLTPAGTPVAVAAPAPPEPTLMPRRGANTIAVEYSVPQDINRPTATKIVAGLVTTDATSPAITVTADLRGPSGTIELPAPTHPDRVYEIRATTHDENGRSSATASIALPQ
jgi:hypothetical protein